MGAGGGVGGERVGDDVVVLFEVAVDLKRHDSAEPAHLFFCKLVLLVARKSRLVDSLDVRVFFQMLRHNRRRAVLSLHPEGISLHPAQQEKTGIRVGHAAGHFLKILDALEVLFASQHCAGEDVVVAAQKLRAAVNDYVDSSLQRLLIVRPAECAVNHGCDLVPAPHFGDPIHIGDVEIRTEKPGGAANGEGVLPESGAVHR